MFSEARIHRENTPLDWEPEVEDFEEFLKLLNVIMTTAPECYFDSSNCQKPAGLIGFPINALLNWPMATTAGYAVFANALVNQQFEEIFKSNPHDQYYGFACWDEFFVRGFQDGVRPVSHPDDDSVIVNACESAPYRLSQNVALSDQFWLKEQRYSLENMLNWDEYSPQFVGGTVYQAFLSALSYHRWHSPVSGTVKRTYVVNGSYYLESQSQMGMAEVSSCEIKVKPGDHLKKGDELGMFHFGGSSRSLPVLPS
ncbi:hypothetical protein EMCRGX_G007598 [Ephydatia muelleri]